jgi:AraC-like DNA-binding protein
MEVLLPAKNSHSKKSRRKKMGRAWVNDKPFSYESLALDSIDELRTPVLGTDCQITQLGSGRLKGRLTRASVGDVTFSIGSFSLPIRATGVLSQTRLTIGTLLRASDSVRGWWGPIDPGTIFIIPANVDHYNVYSGGASFAGMSLDCIELSMILGNEGPLSDPDFWSQRRQHGAESRQTAQEIERRLLVVMAHLAKHDTLSPMTADFLKRSVVDAFAMHLLTANTDAPAIASTFRMVKEVEEYVDARSHRPVHISEICAQLNVSRRTLYRSFDDVLGIGPSTFLRQKRLSWVHAALRRLDPKTTRVTQVATEFGFIELGRFSQHYKLLFGEYPNETLRRRI